MYAMTAAHPTLPIPSYARIRNPANGREVLVRVNDRGPFLAGRIVDLSYAAAFKLDLLRGVAPVELERITFEEIRAGAWRGGGVRVAAAAHGDGARGRGRRPTRRPTATTAALAATIVPPTPRRNDDLGGARVARAAAVDAPSQDVALASGGPGAACAASSTPSIATRPGARPRRSGARLLGPARRVPRARRRRDVPAAASAPMANRRGSSRCSRSSRSGAVSPAGRPVFEPRRRATRPQRASGSALAIVTVIVERR